MSYIWGVLKYYEPVFIANIPRGNRAISCLYYKAKKFRTLRNWRIKFLHVSIS